MKKSTIVLLLCYAIATNAQTQFENVTDAMGLSDVASMGATWADFDNDGFADLFANGVWHNDGGEGFTKVHGTANQTSVADTNGDGFLDVAGMSEAVPTVAYSIYNGETGQWEDKSGKFETVPTYRPYSSFWADFNGDGLLDYYITGMTSGTPFEGHPTHDYIYFAETAEDGSIAYNIKWTSPSTACTRGATPCDFDRDGDIDVHTSGYWMTGNYLFVNPGDGQLTNSGGMGIPHPHSHGIGACWGDFDNDGWMDLYVSNFSHPGNPPPAFARNNAGNNFEDKGQGGIAWVESQGSVAAADYDNDGDLDLMITALYTPSYRLMRNDGNWSFTDVTVAAGLGGIGPSYQVSWGDFNNDGYPDLMAHGRLLKNPGGENHWLKVKLTAAPLKESCRDQNNAKQNINASAVGAQVRIAVPELGTVTRHVETGTGQGNQNELTLHFGLGSYAGALTLDIFWPDGETQVVLVDTVDQLVTIERK
jgi:hypothetical protein